MLVTSGPPSGAPSPPRILVSYPDFVIGAWGHVVVLVVRGAMRTDLVQALDLELKKLAPREPIGTFSIVEAEHPLPGLRERGELARALGSVPISFSAIVYEGTGFRLAALRAVVTGITLLLPRTTPTHVFGSIGDAARWSERQDPRVGPAAALESAVRVVRLTPPQD